MKPLSTVAARHAHRPNYVHAQQPADFAALRWTNGDVRTSVDLADGYIEDAKLPLGKAFLLDDKTPTWKGMRSD